MIGKDLKRNRRVNDSLSMENLNKKEISLHALRRYESLRDLSLKITTDYLEAHRLDVSQLRSLIIQISVISFGIVGFSIPLIGSLNIIKTQLLFVLGLMLISFCAIYGLWYITAVLQNSVIKAQEGWMKNKKEVQEALENERFLIKNPEKFEEYEKRRQKLEKKLKSESVKEIRKDKFMYFLLTLLSSGIILIFLSLFEITVGL